MSLKLQASSFEPQGPGEVSSIRRLDTYLQF